MKKRNRNRAAAALGCVAAVLLVRPVNASSPVSHILIAEQVMDRIQKDPAANPELRAILKDPEARLAFSGGACAPDLDSLAEQAHTSSPKSVADAIMGTARARLARAQAALASADTPEQRARAERVVKQAQCDIAFAYGWRCHAAADFETHPEVNASGQNYWDDETRNRFQEQKDQATHGEWEVMQEANWTDKYGHPRCPNVDYRLGLLEQALGFEHDDLLEDVKTLSNKEYAADYVGTKYPQSLLDDWRKRNDRIGDASITRGVDFVNRTDNPLDGSCWDVGWGIPVDEFRAFIEDTKKRNGGSLPADFFTTCNSEFVKWRAAGGCGAAGAAGADATAPLLPPPLQGAATPAGSGSGRSGGAAPKLGGFR